MLHVPGLYILETDKKGRGIFTSELLSDGDMIEICPVIKIPKDQMSLLDKTILFDYYFQWNEDQYLACIVLGYGSIYNHSICPNASFTVDYIDDTIKINCISTINPGEEILIDYTGDGLSSEADLWFRPV